MSTVSINLPPDLNSLVERKVTSGQFYSEEAVLCEGLRLHQEREELGKPDFEVSTLEELEAKLLVGLEQLERGEGIPGEQVFAELKKHSRHRRSCLSCPPQMGARNPWPAELRGFSPSPQPSPAGRGRNAFRFRTGRDAKALRALADFPPLPAGEGRGEGERPPHFNREHGQEQHPSLALPHD